MYIHVYICVVCLLDRILMIVDIHTYMYMYVCACICDGTKHARERGGRHSWIQTHTQTCMNTHAHTHTHISRIHTHTHRCMSYMGLHVNIKYTCNLHHFYTIHQMKRAETARKRSGHSKIYTPFFFPPLFLSETHTCISYVGIHVNVIYTCIHVYIIYYRVACYIHIYIYTYIHIFIIYCVYMYISRDIYIRIYVYITIHICIYHMIHTYTWCTHRYI